MATPDRACPDYPNECVHPWAHARTYAEVKATQTDHTCCYHVAAAHAVLADRERELLDLKGPCSNSRCRLHYAHSGPCDTTNPTA